MVVLLLKRKLRLLYGMYVCIVLSHYIRYCYISCTPVIYHVHQCLCGVVCIHALSGSCFYSSIIYSYIHYLLLYIPINTNTTPSLYTGLFPSSSLPRRTPLKWRLFSTRSSRHSPCPSLVCNSNIK